MEEEEECHLEVRTICCNRFSPISVHYFFSKAHALSLGAPGIQVCCWWAPGVQKGQFGDIISLFLSLSPGRADPRGLLGNWVLDASGTAQGICSAALAAAGFRGGGGWAARVREGLCLPWDTPRGSSSSSLSSSSSSFILLLLWHIPPVLPSKRSREGKQRKDGTKIRIFSGSGASSLDDGDPLGGWSILR